MHRLSVALSKACLTYGWIVEADLPWCIYTLEKKLIALVFFTIMIPVAAVIGKLAETIIFSVTLLLIRRRIGGWHAPRAWLCQVLSVSIVLITLFMTGPWAARLPPALLYISDGFIMAAALLKKPVCPPQVHFDSAIIQANNQKKNLLILSFLAVQLVLGRFYIPVVIYSGLAVLAGVLSVYIEKIHQLYISRKENNNEKTSGNG